MEGNRMIRVPSNCTSMEVKASWGEAGKLKISVDWNVPKLAPLFDRQVAHVIRSFQAASAKTLHRALRVFLKNGQRDDLHVLLLAGAEVDGTVRGQTALRRAVEQGLFSFEAVRMLVRAGARLDIKGGGSGGSALHRACWRNLLAIAKFLLLRGANVNSENESGLKPIHISSMLGFTRLTEILLSHGADICATTLLGHTALHCACGFGHRGTAEVLLDLGADVNSVDPRKVSPLHLIVLPFDCLFTAYSCVTVRLQEPRRAPCLSGSRREDEGCQREKCSARRCSLRARGHSTYPPCCWSRFA
uniref:Uncharacterized protein n=1 Tax=Chromera velia CCMP2878 TaxID=1169474 RepID=A0A0G4HMD7_9ALVE|eukprot:Cvel_29122.t1-p1 / transcript=Cvel_29122.t1 / gene=Cvel_29122 / organism=Chromera_velia_CCMP2878 / gene_product=Putative ankyrin repeat protein RF_0381, putative / transcript_product=Putative ankyrin repeat protein RF_0381, putative / location=Cvel_scaffold3933:2725-3630(-) / protein_length=302 / sequence_SO=supercontig / SO=protein_coding / is_pseudo=false